MDAQADQQQQRTLIVRLHPETEVQVARRVAAIVLRHLARTQPEPKTETLTASEVAKRYRLHRGWIYEHAEELGAIRIGNGPRPRLRFDAEQVERRLTSAREEPVASARPLK